MFTLIKGAEIYAPDFLGKKDILLAFGKVAMISDSIQGPFPCEVEVIDAGGDICTPGFIDAHVHIIGGGGEGGFSTRTPEIEVSDLAGNGITTVVGVLGTDGVTRHPESLYAKAKALEDKGVSTYIYTGSYQIPPVTLTGSVQRDIVLIEKVLGIGEIAISDHRSFYPTTDELARIAAEARIGGMISGKAGIVHLHMGDGSKGMAPIYQVLENSNLPITQFFPTHINRNRNLLEQSVDYAKKGGFIDLTAGFETGEEWPYCVSASEALKFLLDAGVDVKQITLSSDGNGSIPSFDSCGNLVGFEVASCRVLLDDVKTAAVKQRIPLQTALRLVTQNPARILKIDRDKGSVSVGKDGDLLLLDHDLNIEMVFSKGRKLIDKRDM